jgi:hypothetical protein
MEETPQSSAGDGQCRSAPLCPLRTSSVLSLHPLPLHAGCTNARFVDMKLQCEANMHERLTSVGRDVEEGGV